MGKDSHWKQGKCTCREVQWQHENACKYRHSTILTRFKSECWFKYDYLRKTYELVVLHYAPMYIMGLIKHTPVTHLRIPACDLLIVAVPSAVPLKRHPQDLNQTHVPVRGPRRLIWFPEYSINVHMWKCEWEGDTVPCPCGPSRCTSVHMSFWSHTHLVYPGQDREASHETLSQMNAHQIHVCCKDEKGQDRKLPHLE